MSNNTADNQCDKEVMEVVINALRTVRLSIGLMEVANVSTPLLNIYNVVTEYLAKEGRIQ